MSTHDVLRPNPDGPPELVRCTDPTCREVDSHAQGRPSAIRPR